jgi:hypothetical protein
MPPKKKAAAKTAPAKAATAKSPKFPKATLEKALGIPYALKDKNGGNPWEPEEIRKAVGMSQGNAWYSLTAASRDYGVTSGARDSPPIALTELGREIVYAPDPTVELTLKKQAFLNIDIFKRVLEYYKGSNLPDMQYLGNVLTKQFGLDAELHEEFARIFRENCQYLEIVSGPLVPPDDPDNDSTPATPVTVTLSEGTAGTTLTAFVILPFGEKDAKHPKGFFLEVLRSLITPAAKDFKVKTANRQGSDMIQSTIVNDLIEADLVIADLTEHNPNVMFELGVRIAMEKPVVLMKAEGTGPLFDVDNMLRVFEYSPNLWQTTIEKDMPNLRDFIKGAWDNRDPQKTYMKILRAKGKA